VSIRKIGKFLLRATRDVLLSVIIAGVLLGSYTYSQPDLREAAKLTYIENKNYFQANAFVNHWNEMINRARLLPSVQVAIPIPAGADQYQLIKAVNDYISYDNYPYMHDKEQYGKVEYWATPYEFFTNGKGDCEDYAIAKYSVLKALGIPAENMFLAVMKHSSQPFYDRSAHAVLMVNYNGLFLILDNAQKSMYTLNTALEVGYEFKFVINEYSYKVL
jgi:predicted transglutaminase-like cysteine proteinase